MPGARVSGSAGTGHRVLACSSAGGHFKQLVGLVGRLPDVGEVTWLTHDRGLSREILEQAGRGHEQLVHAPYASPRDVKNLARDALVARRLLRAGRYDLAVSTGAGIAVAVLPLARAHGVRACYIESASRMAGPSLSGRILRHVPGIELYSQNRGYPAPWRTVSAVHDVFEPGERRTVDRLRRVVVTVGTIKPYGFERLLARLGDILPADAEVLWQTGESTLAGLAIDGRAHVPGDELAAAITQADVVVAHAGMGTAQTAFELGVCPVLVPRRRAHGEHVDDHQVITARELAARGLAVHVEVEDLTPEVLCEAASRSVRQRAQPPPLRL